MARGRTAGGVGLGGPHRFRGQPRLDLPRTRPRRTVRVAYWPASTAPAIPGRLRTSPTPCRPAPTISTLTGSRRSSKEPRSDWALAAYRFDRYKQAAAPSATLFPGSAAAAGAARVQARAVARVRDLVNTPAGDMMPEDLAAAVSDLAAGHGAGLRVVTGKALLAEGYPAIHVVGRASAHPPRLIDLTWGDPRAPRLTLVGKGVCFDSGGLDIKPASGMRLMKKDMGGAAHAIGLADLVMSTGLPVRLRMLVPAVENAIAGNAYRPGDVVPTRKGLTIEVDNTDAEGRIVLSDALTEGAADIPDLMIDFARPSPARRASRWAPICPRCSPTTTRLPTASRRPGATSRRGLADAAARAVPRDDREQGRGHRERDEPTLRWGDHRRAVPAGVRAGRDPVGALRHHGVDDTREAGPRPVGGEAMALRAVFEFLERRYRS